MEPEDSLPCSQILNSYPYTEPVTSYPYLILLFENIQYIFPLYTFRFFPLCIPSKILYTFLISPVLDNVHRLAHPLILDHPNYIWCTNYELLLAIIMQRAAVAQSV
jgi:hypothetical protein